MTRLFPIKPRVLITTFMLLLFSVGCTNQKNSTEAAPVESTSTAIPAENGGPTPLPPSATIAPPTPTQTPLPTEASKPILHEIYESDGLGIRVNVPVDWSTKESKEWGDWSANQDEKSLDLGISPHSKTLESNFFHQSSLPFSSDFKESAQVLFLGDLLNEGEGTMDEPIDILMFSLAWFLMGETLEGGEFIHEPEAVDINGFGAAIASVRAPGPPNEEDVTWVWAVVKRNWSDVIWVIGIDGTEDARYHEMILETVQSIEFNAPPDEFSLEEMGIKMEVPDGWFFDASPEFIEVLIPPSDPLSEKVEISILDFEILREDFPEDINEEPIDLIAHLLEMIGVPSGEVELVQEPVELDINGNTAAMAVVRDDDNLGEGGGSILVLAIIKNADGDIGKTFQPPPS